MNEKKITASEFERQRALNLDALLEQTRVMQPTLIDDNFTKVVVNRLPVNVKRGKANSKMFDAIGLILGLIAAFLFFDSAAFIHNALSVIPESLTLTVTNLTFGISALFVFAWGAWWTAEKAIH